MRYGSRRCTGLDWRSATWQWQGIFWNRLVQKYGLNLPFHGYGTNSLGTVQCRPITQFVDMSIGGSARVAVGVVLCRET